MSGCCRAKGKTDQRNLPNLRCQFRSHGALGPETFVVGTAAVLTLAGLVGLQQASGHRLLGRSLEYLEGEGDALDAELSTHLARRELTLDLRRESEQLIQQFIRAQMTSHYWGQFASSLTDLGL